jgi:hypothetical protein
MILTLTLPLIANCNHCSLTTLLRRREICKQEPFREDIGPGRDAWNQALAPGQNLDAEWTFPFVFSWLTPEFCASIIAEPKKYALHVGVQSIQPIIAGIQIGLVIQGKDS